MRFLIVCDDERVQYWENNFMSLTTAKVYMRDIVTMKDAYKQSGRSFVGIIYDKKVPPKVRERLNAMIRYAE